MEENKEILTATAVPKIPPAKVHVPQIPKRLFLCWLLKHWPKILVQLGQAWDWIRNKHDNNNNNNNRHFYSAVYLDNSVPRRIYYYHGFSLAAVYTALQHFKELIPARCPFTSPGLSVANVDQCLAKGY